MKCQICQENEGTIQYTEIVDGQKSIQWLCPACAEREGITPTEGTPLSHGGLESFLGGMLSGPGGGPATTRESPVPSGLACECCGYPFEQLQQKGQLGCPDCYTAFRSQLLPMLRRYHGHISHMGKIPRSFGPDTALRQEVGRLRLQLEQAVAMENYEEAARLRDEIRDREQELGGARRRSDERSPEGGGGEETP
jgi:protein arginine kinase activator